MQNAQYQSFSVKKVKCNCSSTRCVMLLIFLCLPLSVSPAQSQNPGTQNPAIQQAESKPDQLTKSELQQKQLAEDTAKLFELANELKADMDKTTKDTLSLAVVKKAEQVEKLAHKVREEMKASLGN